MPDGILARVQHEIACYGTRVEQAKKKKKEGGGGVIHVKLKSWLRPLGPTVQYLNILLLTVFLVG